MAQLSQTSGSLPRGTTSGDLGERPRPLPGLDGDDAVPADVASGVNVVAVARGTFLPAWASRFVQNMATQDWFLAVYFALLLGALAMGNGPGRAGCVLRVVGDIAIFVAALVLTRGGILREGSFAHGVAYRTGILASVLFSYFQLRHILPAVTNYSLDGDILAFDVRTFGFEPAIVWDAFVTPRTTEWFAFFYFSYFLLLVVHVLPISFGERSAERTSHFVLGILFVFCTGHLTYMLVPGYGPYRLLDGHFQNPLQGGFFWSMVLATVEAGGAQKDIFPSLHTAAPTFFAIYSFMHRKAWPYRYTWPVIAFFATQIIVATMFLRWHWLIDVVAGATLAASAALLSRALARREAEARDARGLPPVFWPLPLPARSIIQARGTTAKNG